MSCSREFSEKYSVCPYCGVSTQQKYPEWEQINKKQIPVTNKLHPFFHRLFFILFDPEIRKEVFYESKYNFESIIVYLLSVSIVFAYLFHSFSDFIINTSGSYTIGYLLSSGFILSTFVTVILIPLSLLYLWLIKFIIRIPGTVTQFLRVYSYIFFDINLIVLFSSEIVIVILSYLNLITLLALELIGTGELFIGMFLMVFFSPIVYKTVLVSNYAKVFFLFLLSALLSSLTCILLAINQGLV